MELKRFLYPVLSFLRLKTVNALIIENKKLLTVKRKKIPWRRIYAMPGGKIEINENEEQAVIREVKEETGYKTDIEKKIITDILWWYFIPFAIVFYKAKIIGGAAKIQKSEIYEMRWMTKSEFLDNLKNYNFSERRIKKFYKILNTQ